MDNLYNTLNLNLFQKKNHHSEKEHSEINQTTKLCYKVSLQKLQSWQILHVLRTKIVTIFD